MHGGPWYSGIALALHGSGNSFGQCCLPAGEPSLLRPEHEALVWSHQKGLLSRTICCIFPLRVL